MALKVFTVSFLLIGLFAVTVSSPSKPRDNYDLLDALIQALLIRESDDAGKHSYLNTQQVADCGPLEDPVGGAVSFLSTTFLSIAAYTCNSPYELLGDSVRVCQADATWSGEEPLCGPRVPCDCGPPPTINNGKIDEDLSDPNNLCFTDSGMTTQKTYRCDIGFEFPDGSVTTQITCPRTLRTWTPIPVPDCQLVDCGSLEDPVRGAVIFSSTTFQSIASYTCDSLYNLLGDSMRVCQADATWSGEEPECQDCFSDGSPCTNFKQCCSRSCAHSRKQPWIQANSNGQKQCQASVM